MAERMDVIPMDFYTDSGFLKSITIPATPHVGETVVVDGKMYEVQKVAWDFDVGGTPLLLRVNVG